MAREAVTSFSSGTEGDKGKEDHTYEVLPFEANEEEQQTPHMVARKTLQMLARVLLQMMCLCMQTSDWLGPLFGHIRYTTPTYMHCTIVIYSS